jgi:hypothetical protein
MRTLLVLALAGCSNSSLTINSDGGGDLSAGGGDLKGADLAGADLTATATGDLAGVTCDQVAAAITSFISSHQTCLQDRDCSLLLTGCGLPAVCGGVIALDPTSASLPSLFAQWKQMQCMGACPPCALLRSEPVCQMGKCALVPTLMSTAPVGDGCTTMGECASSVQCIASGPLFALEGDCSLAQCDTLNRQCPAESDCEREPMDGVSYCLRRCVPSGWDCRSGFVCCPRPGLPGEGWCHPTGDC